MSSTATAALALWLLRLVLSCTAVVYAGSVLGVLFGVLLLTELRTHGPYVSAPLQVPLRTSRRSRVAAEGRAAEVSCMIIVGLSAVAVVLHIARAADGSLHTLSEHGVWSSLGAAAPHSPAHVLRIALSSATVVVGVAAIVLLKRLSRSEASDADGDALSQGLWWSVKLSVPLMTALTVGVAVCAALPPALLCCHPATVHVVLVVVSLVTQVAQPSVLSLLYFLCFVPVIIAWAFGRESSRLVVTFVHGCGLVNAVLLILKYGLR
jgi:hypothetical protein